MKENMNKAAFENLMYGLLKEASRSSFIEFLENWGVTEEEYEEIKKHLEETYDIEMYL